MTILALNTDSIASFLTNNIIYLLLIVVVITMMGRSRKGETAQNVTSAFNVILALVVLGLAANVSGVSTWLANMVWA